MPSGGLPRIALVGDHDASVTAHRAIPLALESVASGVWIATDSIIDTRALDGFDGIWCVPASPYRSMDGALIAIRHARTHAVPFLGTCGGFQHALIEYARHALGWRDAEHAETTTVAARAIITPLTCALVEAQGTIRLVAGSRIAAAYGTDSIVEGYHCSYGLDSRYAADLLAGELGASAFDDAGEVRAVELASHPFYVATLFQPERAALAGRRAPLVDAFVQAARQARAAA